MLESKALTEDGCHQNVNNLILLRSLVLPLASSVGAPLVEALGP